MNTFATVSPRSDPCIFDKPIYFIILKVCMAKGIGINSTIKVKVKSCHPQWPNGDPFTWSQLRVEKRGNKKKKPKTLAFCPVCVRCSECIRKGAAIHKNKLLWAASQQKFWQLSLSLIKNTQKLTFTQSDVLS